MPTTRWKRLIVLVLAVGLLVAACGGKKANDEQRWRRKRWRRRDAEAKESAGIGKGETGLADAGEPKRGGTVTYGLDAESDGGWCLPESQLSIAGTMVRLAVYDTLTTLDSESKPKPFLAESVEADATNETFTITLREGVTFHDGTKLTAEVVKNNLDAYLGRYPTRKPLLTPFILEDIDTVTATGPLTVEITTKRPWPTMPMYLATFGIMAQSQLDDEKTCDRKLVGTGPFVFDSWKRGLRREPVPQRQVLAGGARRREAAVPRQGRVQADRRDPDPDQHVQVRRPRHGDDVAPRARSPSCPTLQQAGDANLLVSEDNAEVNYVLLNNAEKPFDDERVRKAFAMALDREKINEIINDGIPTVSDQPFYKGNIAYLDDPGFPDTDVREAKRLVKEYEADGGDASFVMTVQNDPDVVRRSELIQDQLKDVGISMRITPVEQAQLINLAIGGKFQAETFRQFASTDPDTNYVWWKSGSPVNFARIDDPTDRRAARQGSGQHRRGRADRDLPEPQQEDERQRQQHLALVHAVGGGRAAERPRDPAPRPARRLEADDRPGRRPLHGRRLDRRLTGAIRQRASASSPLPASGPS